MRPRCQVAWLLCLAALVSLLGAAVLSVAGTAFFIYYENFIGLGIFWAVGFAVVAYYYYSTVLTKE